METKTKKPAVRKPSTKKASKRVTKSARTSRKPAATKAKKVNVREIPVLMGKYPAGQFALFLGTKGVKPVEAIHIMKKFGMPEDRFVPTANKYVNDRLWRGANKKGGRPAAVTPEDWKKIDAARKEAIKNAPK